MKNEYRLLPLGDKALLVQFPSEISPSVNDDVLFAREAVESAKLPFVTETVQTYRSLVVYYNPLAEGYEKASAAVKAALERANGEKKEVSGRLAEIPVCYEAEFAPDIEFVCRHTGLSAEAVVSLHSETVYRVYMMGFLPGFAYLGGMNPVLATPRLASPRVRIEPGSVGIAGAQTGIYPTVSPGGWQLIGRTPIKLFDKNAENPVLLCAGDSVRFKPISAAEYRRLEREVESGSYCLSFSEEKRWQGTK